MKRIYISLIASVLSAPLCAADNKELDTVTIHAQQHKNYSLSDFSGHHQRIDRADFTQHFTQLPDLLEQQSGIEIQSMGGIGQYSTPSIRGSSSQQVLVFWDGMLINSLNGGGTNLSNLSLSSASQIDIYRSLAPIELSASAVGGVIHLQSRELGSDGGNNGEASAVLGSYGVQQYSANQEISNDKNQLFISAEWLQADNDFSYLEMYPVSNPNQPQHEPRYNNGSEQYHILVKGSHFFTESRVDVALQSSKAIQELTAAINYPQNNAHLDTTSNNVQLRWQKPWNQYFQSEFLGHVQKQTQLYDDRDSRIGLGAQLNEYSTTGYRLQMNQYAVFNNLNIAFTVRNHQEEIDTDFKLVSAAAAQQQCANGYGCETAYSRSQLDVGTRIQYWLNNTRFTAQASNITIADKNLDLRGQKDNRNANTWYLAVQHDFSSGLNVYLNISEQLRLPATHELFGDRGTSMGNATLLPEKALSYETGAHLQLNQWKLSSNLYFRDVKDAIVAETDSRGVIHFNNLAQTQHLGFEQDIQWQPITQLILNANLTVQSNEIVEHRITPFYQGNQVAGLSPVHTFLSAKWQQRFWDMSLTHNTLMGGYYTNSNILKKDSENRWDAAFGLFGNNWRASISVTDITNNAARDFPSYPEPGRMYFMRLHYQW